MIKADNARERAELRKEQGKKAQKAREDRHKKMNEERKKK